MRTFWITDAAGQKGPVLVPLLVGMGLAGSTAVGTAALITGDKHFKDLSHRMDLNL